MFGAIIFYTYWRKRIWNFEFIIPFLLGTAPGVLIWHFFLKRAAVPDFKTRLLQERSEDEGQIPLQKPETPITTEKQEIKPSVSSTSQPSATTVPTLAPAKNAVVEKRYHVVFSGEIAPEQQIENVKKRVAALYKVPVSQCEQLFNEKKHIIKKDVDYQTAEKYKRAFEKTGAICSIEEFKKP
jgi:hypothetical protein